MSRPDRTGTLRIALAGFKKFKEIYGNLMIPTSFTVPFSDTRWPEEHRGEKFGRHAYKVFFLNRKRPGLYNPQDMKELTDLGFDWERDPSGTTGRKFKYEGVNVVALVTFYEIHGHLDIPKRFIISEGDRNYPEFLWNMDIGRLLHTVKNCSKCKVSFDILVEKGILRPFEICMRPSSRDTFSSFGEIVNPDFDLVYSALLAYKDKYGDVNVPWNFEVRLGDVEYPRKTHGMWLGREVSRIRHAGFYDEPYQKRLLEEIGFDYSVRRNPPALFILAALEIYGQLNGGKVDQIGFNYVVPNNRNCTDWPDEFKGFDLGRWVCQVREHGMYSEFSTDFKYLGLTVLPYKATQKELDRQTQALLHSSSNNNDNQQQSTITSGSPMSVDRGVPLPRFRIVGEKFRESRRKLVNRDPAEMITPQSNVALRTEFNISTDDTSADFSNTAVNNKSDKSSGGNSGNNSINNSNSISGVDSFTSWRRSLEEKKRLFNTKQSGQPRNSWKSGEKSPVSEQPNVTFEREKSYFTEQKADNTGSSGGRYQNKHNKQKNSVNDDHTRDEESEYFDHNEIVAAEYEPDVEYYNSADEMGEQREEDHNDHEHDETVYSKKNRNPYKDM